MLVGEGRYNAAKSLGPLEAYAQQQVKEGSYDLDANLALLKVRALFGRLDRRPSTLSCPARRVSQLYQFGGKANNDVVALVLVKALMQLPSSDFSLCLCLLSDATAQVPPQTHRLRNRTGLTRLRLVCVLWLLCLVAVGHCERTAKAVKPAGVVQLPGLLGGLCKHGSPE